MLKAVHNYFATDYKYCLKNSFVFRYDWESDYFCVNNEGYSFEIEVKISKADFKNDFKKDKHQLFLAKDTKRLVPNRFYYAVPKNLIKESDIPPYAGLIYVEGSHAQIVKRAPFINKKKYDFRKVLCDKFYYKWLQQEKKLNIAKYDLDVANNKIEKFWINGFTADKLNYNILKIDYENKKVTGEQVPYWNKKTNEYIKTREVKEFDIKDVKFK